MTVLKLMEPLIEQTQASGENFAYLYGRTHYPQRYGTQGDCVSRTEWQPFDTDDMANVDLRRRAVNLPRNANYAKLMKGRCADPYVLLHSESDVKRTVEIPTQTEKTPPDKGF